MDRTKEEFEELLMLSETYKVDEDIKQKHLDLCIKCKREYLLCPDMTAYEIKVQKSKKVENASTVFNPSDDLIAKEVMGEEAYEEYKKRQELLKNASKKSFANIVTTDYNAPIKIWRDYETGLLVSETEIYKGFLYNNDRVYSFGPIAKFLGFELNIINRGSEKRPEIYLIFKKVYSEFLYYTINDLFFESKNDNDKLLWQSKKLLTYGQVKNEIEEGVNKIIEFTNIVEETVKKILGPQMS